MAAFAKLFDTAHGQLLVTVLAEDDDGLSPLTIRAEERRGIIPELTTRYETIAECEAALAGFDQSQADIQAKALTGIVERFAA